MEITKLEVINNWNNTVSANCNVGNVYQLHEIYKDHIQVINMYGVMRCLCACGKGRYVNMTDKNELWAIVKYNEYNNKNELEYSGIIGYTWVS